MRTIAGIRRNNALPSDGSIHIDDDATLRWTTHFGGFGTGREVRFFRCNLDLVDLTGPAERVEIQSDLPVASVVGTCEMIDC